MQPSIICLSAEEKINLWKRDLHFSEYAKIKEAAKKPRRSLDFKGEIL